MKFSSIVISAAILASFVAVTAYADDISDRTEASRAAAQEFQGKLQAALQNALKEGGPVSAIEVCNKKAPDIAAEISKSKGWEVGRTSLKLRNKANAPDAWEKAVLKKFEARKKAGEDVTKIEHAEIVTQKGKKQFRYMKAIPVAGPCLKCHGESLDADLKAKLKSVYPGDRATGFKMNDLRGAFTITQPL